MLVTLAKENWAISTDQDIINIWGNVNISFILLRVPLLTSGYFDPDIFFFQINSS